MALLAALLFLPDSIDSDGPPTIGDAVSREAAAAADEEQPVPGNKPDGGAQPAAPEKPPGATASEGESTDEGAEDDNVAGEARGSIHQTVDPKPGVVADPVGIDDVAEFGNGVRARLSAIESIEAKALLPGEFGGPAVVVTVEVANGSSDTINLDTVTVDLTFGDGSSAYTVTDPERARLSGDLAAGDSTTGDYVFTLAPDERADLQIRIKYSAETPTVVFAGSVADG